MKSKAVCVGELMWEVIQTTKTRPRRNQTHVVSGESRRLGGPVINVAWYLEQLGQEPVVASPYGDRQESAVRKEFQRMGLGTSGLVPYDGLCDLLIAHVSPKHHYSVYIREEVSLAAVNAVRTQCQGFDCQVLLGSRHPQIRSLFTRLPVSQATLRVFNPSYAIPEYEGSELARVMARSHITILNLDEATEAKRLLGLRSRRALVEASSDWVIVTKGREGAEILGRSESWTVPSYSHTSRDVIGAGDAFIGGLVHSLMSGQKMRAACEHAARVAAEVADTGRIRARLRTRVRPTAQAIPA